jgi:hypothetical protein
MSKGPARKIAIREPNGRISRIVEKEIDATSPATAKRLMEAALRGQADAVYGTHIGRLFIDGKLSPHEFEAGKRWDRLRRLYADAMRAPSPDPRSVSIDGGGGGFAPDVDSDAGMEEAKRHRQITRAWYEAMGHLNIWCGGLEIKAMQRLCEGQGLAPEGMMGLIRAKEALGALVVFWDLTNSKKPSQS